MIYWPRDPEIEAGFITWAGRELGITVTGARALGFLRDREIKGVVLYSNWSPDYRSVEASIVLKDGLGLNRSELRWIFWYPFRGLGANRLQVTVAKKNRKSAKFVERLGFKYEGKGRQAFLSDDAKVYSMLEAEWLASPWYMELPDGQEQQFAAAG